MNDPPPDPKPPRFIDSSGQYPSVEQRTAAWHREFESNSRPFRGAFEHAAIGMALCDLEGRFLKVNRSLCRIVGYSEEELLATDFQTITYPDDLEADLALAGQVMRGEIDYYHMEKRYFDKQGHIIWILLSVSMARDEAGQPCYFIAQIQDISARKAAQQESADRLRHLERLTQTVSKILHSLESTIDDTVYSNVLRILLDSFQSQKGLFLRFTEDGMLVGPYLSTNVEHYVRCLPADRCDLWDAALREETALIENRSRQMGCGKLVARSLVAPIRHDGVQLGLFHIGDSDADYNAEDFDLLNRVSSIIAPVVYARMERDKLTPREAEVMDLIVSGKTQKQIASELAISIQTAAKHRAKVLEKLQVCNDVELVHLALRMRTPSA
jgi:PAS domain S-box-containing protein